MKSIVSDTHNYLIVFVNSKLNFFFSIIVSNYNKSFNVFPGRRQHSSGIWTKSQAIRLAEGRRYVEAAADADEGRGSAPHGRDGAAVAAGADVAGGTGAEGEADHGVATVSIHCNHYLDGPQAIRLVERRLHAAAATNADEGRGGVPHNWSFTSLFLRVFCSCSYTDKKYFVSSLTMLYFVLDFTV